MNTKAKIFADALHDAARARVLESAVSHTPGPWAVKGCSGKLGEAPGLFIEANGRPLMRGDFCRSEADADLIAAAPDMLAALRLTVTALGSHCLTDVLNPCWDARPTDVAGEHWGGGNACAVCTARAIIAQATGAA